MIRRRRSNSTATQAKREPTNHCRNLSEIIPLEVEISKTSEDGKRDREGRESIVRKGESGGKRGEEEVSSSSWIDSKGSRIYSGHKYTAIVAGMQDGRKEGRCELGLKRGSSFDLSSSLELALDELDVASKTLGYEYIYPFKSAKLSGCPANKDGRDGSQRVARSEHAPPSSLPPSPLLPLQPWPFLELLACGGTAIDPIYAYPVATGVKLRSHELCRSSNLLESSPFSSWDRGLRKQRERAKATNDHFSTSKTRGKETRLLTPLPPLPAANPSKPSSPTSVNFDLEKSSVSPPSRLASAA